MSIKKIDLKTTDQTVGKTSRTAVDGKYKKFVIGRDNDAAKDSVFYNKSLLDSKNGAVRSINRDESKDIWSDALEYAGYDGVLNEEEMKAMFQDWGYLKKDDDSYETWAARQQGEGSLKLSEEELQERWAKLGTADGYTEMLEKGIDEFTSYAAKQFGVDLEAEAVEQTAEESLAADKAALTELAQANPDNQVLQDIIAQATAPGADLAAIYADVEAKIASGEFSVDTVVTTSTIDSKEDLASFLTTNYPEYKTMSSEERKVFREEFMNANPTYFNTTAESANGTAYDARTKGDIPKDAVLKIPGSEVNKNFLNTLKDMETASKTVPQAETVLPAEEAEAQSQIDAEAAGGQLAAVVDSVDDIFNAEGYTDEAKKKALTDYYSSDKFDPAEVQNYPGGTKAYLDNLAAKVPEDTIGFITQDLVGRISDQDTKLEIMQYVNDDYAKEGGPSKLSEAIGNTLLNVEISGSYSTYENNVIADLNFCDSADVNTVMNFIKTTGGIGSIVAEFDAKVQENFMSMTPGQIEQFNSMAASNSDLTKIDVTGTGRAEYKTAEPPYYTQLDADGRLGKYDYETGRKLSATDPDTDKVETFEYTTDENGDTVIKGSFTEEGAETPSVVNTYNAYFEKTGYETHSTDGDTSHDQYFTIVEGEPQLDKDVSVEGDITTTEAYNHETDTTVRSIEDKSELDNKGLGTSTRTTSEYSTIPPKDGEVPVKSEAATLLYVKGVENPIEQAVVKKENEVVVYTKDTLVDTKTGTVKQTSERYFDKEGVLTSGEFTKNGVTYQIDYEQKEETVTGENGETTTQVGYVGKMSIIDPVTGAVEYAGSEYLDSNLGVTKREFYQEVKDEAGNVTGNTLVAQDAEGNPISEETGTMAVDHYIVLDKETDVAVIANAEGQEIADAEIDGKKEEITYRTAIDGKRYQEVVTYADADHTRLTEKVTYLVDENGKKLGTASKEEYDKDGKITTLTEYQEGVDKKPIEAVTTYEYNDQGALSAESKSINGKEVSKVTYGLTTEGTTGVTESQDFIYNADGTRTIVTKNAEGIPTLVQVETTDEDGNVGLMATLDPMAEAQKIYDMTQGNGAWFSAVDADGVKEYLAQTGINLAYISEAFEKTYGKTIKDAIVDSSCFFGLSGATDSDKAIGDDIEKLVADAKAGVSGAFSDVEGFGYVSADKYDTSTLFQTDAKLIDATGHEISPEAQQASLYMDKVLDTSLTDQERKAAAEKLNTFVAEHTDSDAEFKQFMQDCGNAYRYQILDEVPEAQTKDQVNTNYRYFFTAMNAAAELTGENDKVKDRLKSIIKGDGKDADKIPAEEAAEIISAALKSKGKYTERVYTELQYSGDGRTRDIIAAYSEKYGAGSFIKDLSKLDNWDEFTDDFMDTYNQTPETRKALMDEMLAAGSNVVTQKMAQEWKNYPWLGESRVSNAQQAINYDDLSQVTDIAQYYTMCSTEPTCAEGTKACTYITKSDLKWYLDKCKGSSFLSTNEELSSMIANLQKLYDDPTQW